jgi:hypothetical protein
MPRINQLSQISDEKGLMLANELELKSPNGKMFVKKEVMESDTFIQKVIKKDIEIINSAIPTRNKVVPVGTKGATVTADNTEAFIKVPITELTDKDSYWTDDGLKEKNFVVTYEFLDAKTIAELKAWAKDRGITLKSTKKADIINELLA